MVRVVVAYLFYVLLAIFLVSSGNGNVVPAPIRGKNPVILYNLDQQELPKCFFFLCWADNQIFPGCGGYIFVDDEVVIDGPFNEDCIFQFETQEDRILAFTVVDGDLIEIGKFLAVSKIDFIICCDVC